MKHVKKIFLLLAFLAPFSLSSKVEDCFKKALEPKTVHSMPGIDFVYMINLDQRPEKFERSVIPFQNIGINPYRFSAVNGWELTFDQIQDIGVKLKKNHSHHGMGTRYQRDETGLINSVHDKIRQVGLTYFSHCYSRGAMGCLLSHLSILQDAYDSGYETVWIMEDDAEIVGDVWSIPSLIQKLDHATKKNWDVLYTDLNTKNRLGEYVACTGVSFRPNFEYKKASYYNNLKRKVSGDFYRIGLRYGTYSMIVRRSGMEKILNYFKKYHLFLPYDMEIGCVPDIKLYTVSKDIVSTFIDAASDNGSPYYKEKEKASE